MSGEMRTLSPGTIGYSPSWCGVESGGSYVVISKVVHAGMFNAATSVVETFSADAEGVYSLSVGDDSCVRLIHRVYDGNDVEIGEALVRDIAFGTASTPGTLGFADSRTNSLQEAVAAGRADLTYSTAWATNASSVAIKSILLSDQGGEPISTNDMFAAAAPAEGETRLRNLGPGWARLLCQVSDGSGDVLVEYLTDEFKSNGGFFIIVR